MPPGHPTSGRDVDPRGTLTPDLYRKLHTLMITWNRTRGRGSQGAFAVMMLRRSSLKYLPVLINSLHHKDPAYRGLAGVVLGFSGKKEAEEALFSAFRKEGTAPVRYNYLLGLSMMAHPDMVGGPIIETLKAKDDVLAAKGAYLLYHILVRDKDGRFSRRFREAGGEEALLRLLDRKDEKRWARQNAILCLGLYKTEKAIAPLIALLKEKEEPDVVRRGAAQSLQRLTGKEFGGDPASWEAWYGENRKALLWDAKAGVFRAAKDRERQPPETGAASPSGRKDR